MRWNSDLVDNVSNELFWDLKVDIDAIAVSAEAGTVTLRGAVGSLREVRDATRVTQCVIGVWRVDNQLTVREMGGEGRGDVPQAS